MSIIGSANFFVGRNSRSQYKIERSLRFNSADSAYLEAGSWSNYTTIGTPATFSHWVKLSDVGTSNFMQTLSSRNYQQMQGFVINGGAPQWKLAAGGGATAQVTFGSILLRDPSAWYHLVISSDGSSSSSWKLWVNGVEYAGTVSGSFVGGNNTNTASLKTDNNFPWIMGRRWDDNGAYFSGLMAECHLVVGQQLPASSFGETNPVTGVWQPKRYSGGSYGTNGFYLKFADNSGTTSTTLGKDSSGNGNNWTPNNFSILTGGPTSINAASGALPIYNTTDTYGTVKGSGVRTDSNNAYIGLALPMDGANNGTTFTDESATIKGSGSAKSISITGDTKTVTSVSKFYGSSAFFDGTTDHLTVGVYNTSDFLLGSSSFTIELWAYRASTGNYHYMVGKGNDNGYWLLVNSSNKLQWIQVNSSSSGYQIITDTDDFPLNKWTHVAAVSNGSTVTLYKNGLSIGTCSVTTHDGNGQGPTNSFVPLAVGGYYGGNTSSTWNGYLQDVRIYKSIAKYTSTFTPPSDTLLSPTVGSGNDSMIDTPTPYADGGNGRGNYCTLNPLDTDPARTSTIGLANGNLDASVSTYATVQYVLRGATMASNGKDYFEITKGDSVNKAVAMGFMEDTAPRSGSTPGTQTYIYTSGDTVNANSGYVYNNTSLTSGFPAVDPGAAGDVIMVAHDRVNKKIWFGKNGTWFTVGGTVGDPATGTAPAITYTTNNTLIPCIGASSFTNTTIRSLNFGQRPFAYTPPAGFLALNTQNLPEPSIKKPSNYMDVLAWTGNGAANNRSFTGLAFSPDFVWGKSRSNAYNHRLYDSVRGAGNNKDLTSNDTGAEGSGSDDLYGYISSFDSNGFSTTKGTVDNEQWNGLNVTYAAWCWDKSATPGFDIVTYTGTGSAQTIAHSLGVAPSMMIVKRRDSSPSEWWVYHSVLGATKGLALNSTSAEQTSSLLWNNTVPTSSVFSLGVGSDLNASGGTYVAYLWSEVAGLSKFGSYTGNGSTDGPFAFCGFRPRWIMMKSSTNAATPWQIFDSARETFNTIEQTLIANGSNAEPYDTASPVDFLSNGFKLRGGASSYNNYNTGTWIFAAFAETPMKYSLAF